MNRLGPTQNLFSSSSPFRAYAFAFFASVCAGLLTKWIGLVAGRYFSELLYGAVVLSAWYGGFGPGMCSAVLSFLVFDYFFSPPFNAFTGHKNFLSLLIFAIVAILTGSLNGKLKKAKMDLQSAYEDLEERIKERTAELSRANESLTIEVIQRSEAEKKILEISNREQERLGLELHDGLCQTLAGIKLITEGVKDKLAARVVPEARDLALVESRLGEALAQADAISRGLYPVELEANGLVPALQEMAVKISKIYPVTCRFISRRTVPIQDTAVSRHLYRIAQEAVMNAIKGGKARDIRVRLFPRRAEALLTVFDDGVGFHGKPLRQGMGLKIMDYRSRVIGGVLRFHSRPRGTTLVTCRFPIETPAGADQDGNENRRLIQNEI